MQARKPGSSDLQGRLSSRASLGSSCLVGLTVRVEEVACGGLTRNSLMGYGSSASPQMPEDSCCSPRRFMLLTQKIHVAHANQRNQKKILPQGISSCLVGSMARVDEVACGSLTRNSLKVDMVAQQAPKCQKIHVAHPEDSCCSRISKKSEEESSPRHLQMLLILIQLETM